MASILNNISAMSSRRHLALSQSGLNSTIGKLSTGMRITKASDDAAGLQISNNLRADIRIMSQAQRNANDGIGRIQVADGVLEEATNLLTRAAQLAEQAASGTTSDAGRTAINSEFTEIKAALDSLNTNTKIDGIAVFGSTVDIRVGEGSGEVVSVATSEMSAVQLGIDGDEMSTTGDADTALGNILDAIKTVSALRGTLGAKQQRLNTIVNSLGITSESTQQAESQIRDADVAEEVVNLTKFQVLTQSGVSSLAQANQSAQSVLSLLG
ncbi:MAG: flagellin FliC [Acidobacteria bacterium]|nr:MAG: flagellin FliC [Acidobacteriota bacterium]